MIFYKLMFFRLSLFIGIIVISTFYWFLNNDNDNSNDSNDSIIKVDVLSFPDRPGINKIDVGRGEDFWILTYGNFVSNTSLVYSFMTKTNKQNIALII